MKTYKRQAIKQMEYVLLGDCIHDVKVTHIDGGWNIRVFVNDKLNQESRVFHRQYISTEIREMLRWEDKCGNLSGMASSSRHRN
jgi:hypothetical protein